MNLWKLAIVVVLLGAVGLFAYDGIQVLNARRNISDTASAAAAAAAHAIATSRDCANAHPAASSSSTAKASTTAAASSTATPSGSATPSCLDARAAADRLAKSQGDVVTSYNYDAVAARVSVTVSGSANSLVLHYFDRNLTDNIHASSTARPE